MFVCVGFVVVFVCVCGICGVWVCVFMGFVVCDCVCVVGVLMFWCVFIGFEVCLCVYVWIL